MSKDKARRRHPTDQRRDGTAPSLFAAVDLGTNNCRLLIAERRDQGFHVVDSYAQPARLGEGLAATGRLSEAAIERALDALHKMRAKLRQRKVGKVRCIATEACRKAANGAEFISRVQKETGLTFKIINPREEARLALVGCHDLIDVKAKNALILDIGGGSTEVSLVHARAARRDGLTGVMRGQGLGDWASFPLGVVTLHEAFADLPEAEAYRAMRDVARRTFADWSAAPAIAERIADGASHMIGTSGTVTCLAGVHLNLAQYRRTAVDGAWMSAENARDAIDQLIEAGPGGRAAFPTIGEERADLMPSGCAILEAALTVWPASRIRVADRGLREGVLLSMMHGPKKPKRRRGGRTQRGKRPGDAKPAAADAQTVGGAAT